MRAVTLLIGLFLASGMLASAHPDEQTREVPTRYDEDRFLAIPVTRTGQSLVFLTDTGGGLFLAERAARRLDLPIREEVAGQVQGRNVDLPPFQDDAAVADGSGREKAFPVVATEGDSPIAVLMERKDGMLGAPWFAGRVWTLDYPGRRLWLHAPEDRPAQPSEHRVPLGFQIDQRGKRTTNIPRIVAEIDGVPIDLLLDTGATAVLTDAAVAKLKDDRPPERAASFVIESRFAEWRGRHPEWRAIDGADRVTGTPQPMIEVPLLRVAGQVVGPVWFTRRPDKAFHERMSRWMDKRVDGALGGNALRRFRVTIDYPAGTATFEKPPA